MSAAEQLDTDHVIALGIRCERVNLWASRRVYKGRVGQLAVCAIYVPGLVSVELTGDKIASVHGVGETLEEAESALEQELFARAKALVDVARVIGSLAAEISVPCGWSRECGECAVCREHQRQEAEHTYAELRGYR